MKIAILGAGITGLAAARRMQTLYGKQAEITIFEKASRPGGWISSQEHEGFLFEQGPRSCRTAGTGLATLQLLEELGMQEQVIVPSSTACRRFLFEGGELRKLPEGLLSLLFSSRALFFAKALWRDLRAPVGSEADETIFSFFERRLGSKVAERIIDPLTTGIYAGDMHRLSMRSCFPALFEAERSYGSLIKGGMVGIRTKKKAHVPPSPWIESVRRQPMISLRHGMESLVHTLVAASSADIRLETEVANLDFQPDGVGITLSNGKVYAADRVISTLPASSLTALLPGVPILSSSSVIVINMGYRKKVLKQEGFGYLIPSKEKEALLGVVWDSSVFPEQNRSPEETRLTVIMSEKYFNMDDDRLLETVKASLARHLQIECEPCARLIRRAPHAIPQYPVGHADRIAVFQKISTVSYPRLTLLGTAFHGVSVNDCIASALALI